MKSLYINQNGTRRKVEEEDFVCTSCKYNKFFFSIPSMKHVNRCSKTGVVTSKVQFKSCKYYKKKKIFSEIIIGA